MHRPQVFLFTEYFPFGKQEAFLEHEIPVWGKTNVDLTIFPLKHTDKLKREIGVNQQVELIEEVNELKDYHISKLPVKLIIACLYAYYVESKHRRMNRKLTLSTLFREAFVGLKIMKLYPSICQGICYSYWCNHWMLQLSLLRRAGYIKKLVSRVHGFDLYSERHQRGYIPFQYFMLKSADEVYAISKHGKSYLKHKFNLSKLKVYRLGVMDNGLGPIPEKNNIVRLLSCSSLIDVKQVHIIIESLQQVKRNVEWVHFGDGILKNELHRLSQQLPTNITVRWKGEQTNKKVLEFLSKNPVDLFVNVSKSEGIPVSIMEAMSFGIPVAAPAVGGIPEIVNEKNGYLLENTNKSNQLASIVDSFVSNTELRTSARNTFLGSFSLKNYEDFIENLI